MTADRGLRPELDPASANCMFEFDQDDFAMHERSHINRAGLWMLSLAIALACMVVLTLQVRDRWNSPDVKTAAEAQATTTGQVAREAGARISQSEPKPTLEPEPPGPKPAQPANPD